MSDELAKQVKEVLCDDSDDLERATRLTRIAEVALSDYMDFKNLPLSQDPQAISAVAHVACARALLSIKAGIG